MIEYTFVNVNWPAHISNPSIPYKYPRTKFLIQKKIIMKIKFIASVKPLDESPNLGRKEMDFQNHHNLHTMEARASFPWCRIRIKHVVYNKRFATV